MRYPWVCLSISGVWVATLIISLIKIADPTAIYIYATVTSIVLFLLGFTRS